MILKDELKIYIINEIHNNTQIFIGLQGLVARHVLARLPTCFAHFRFNYKKVRSD